MVDIVEESHQLPNRKACSLNDSDSPKAHNQSIDQGIDKTSRRIDRRRIENSRLRIVRIGLIAASKSCIKLLLSIKSLYQTFLGQTFLNYVNQYTKPFNDISSVISELQSALACAERIYSVLDQEEIAESGQEILQSEDVKGQISFEHVAFGYEPGKELIRDLNIRIPAASKVAIVGPTGAGKSTLINLLMRFYNVDSGLISLDGTPITHYTRASYRQQFGMVLQETWLKTATIHDNIAFGRPDASREEVIAAAKAANAHFFIQQLPQEYDTYLADAGDSLSQGQRQLLTIARVFLAVPKILILDEATSSIDTRTEVLIQEAFSKLMVGRTSFIIAHRLSTIQNADIILVMVDGNIVEHGNHQELMAARGIYYQMQTAQV